MEMDLTQPMATISQLDPSNKLQLNFKSKQK